MLSISKGRRRKMAINNLLIFVLLGALVFIFTTGAIGKWTAANIILPVMNKLNPRVTSETTELPGSTVTRSIIIKPINYYLLQTGAYETQKNADIEAVKLKSRGGAGYVMKGTDYYHVFVSEYGKKTDAQKVQAQLKSNQNIDSTVYTLSASGTRLKLTASKEQADAAEEALELLPQTCSRFELIYTALDKKEATAQESKASLRTLSQELKNIYNKLAAAAGTQPEDEVFAALVSLTRQEADASAGLADISPDNTIDFSSLIKYNHIRMTVEYYDLVKLLSKK